MYVKIEKVTIPDYGDHYIRRGSALLRLKVSEMFAHDVTEEREAQMSADRQYEMRSLIVLHCLVDESGKRVFKSLDEVNECDRFFIDGISNKAAELHRLAVDDSIKNSNPSPSSTSPSE